MAFCIAGLVSIPSHTGRLNDRDTYLAFAYEVVIGQIPPSSAAIRRTEYEEASLTGSQNPGLPPPCLLCLASCGDARKFSHHTTQMNAQVRALSSPIVVGPSSQPCTSPSHLREDNVPGSESA